MKRAVALLLALLLAVGCALAEGAEDVALAPAGEAVEAGVAEADGPLYANAGEEQQPGGAEGGETPEPPAPTELTVKKSATKTVYLGTKYQIVVPGKTVKSYSSSLKRYATVSKSGLVTLKKAGKVKITIRLKNGKKYTLTLKVVDPTVPVSVSISEGKKGTVYVGDTLQLTAVVSPATADQAVKWTSSKKSVAKVNKSGKVTGVKSGTATITATTPNKKKVTFAVTVRRVPVQPFMISHAMGGVDDMNYTNCLEGFLENYAEGHRVFEVDIEFTSDGKLVLCHDWNRKMFSAHKAGKKPTYKAFMAAKIYDRFTPMDIERLLLLMRDYPDATIITDSKYADTATVKKQFKAIVSTARSLGVEEVLDRFVVEIYNKKMLGTVKAIYPFKAYMLTLYKLYKKAPSKSQLKDVASFCQNNGVSMIAMYTKWWKPSYMSILNQYDVDAGLYTTNSAADARKYFKDGVTALFTDFLPPVEH